MIYIFRDIKDIEAINIGENPQDRNDILDYIIQVDGVVLESVYKGTNLDEGFFILDCE